MEKQKICIIGGGLTGLITAIALSKLKVSVDLIVDRMENNIDSNRTIAISQDNYDFLQDLKVFKLNKNQFWPCKEMKLYTKNKNNKVEEIFKLEKINKKIFYMIKNSKVIDLALRELKKDKSISIIRSRKINNIFSSGSLNYIKVKKKILKYNLIILSAGGASSLVKKIFKEKPLEHSYGETSLTTIIKHNASSNNIARQIFLEDEIIALLPISKNQTSIVWSAKKSLLNENKNINLLFKDKIITYTKEYFNNIKVNKKVEKRNLNFLVRKKYYKERILLFGDSLHVTHPLAGQGFNMIIRDLMSLSKALKNKINLGLDIGDESLSSEFSNDSKPRNFVYSIGIDLTKSYFSVKQKSFKNLRNRMLTTVNKSKLAKNFFFNLGNRGFRF